MKKTFQLGIILAALTASSVLASNQLQIGYEGSAFGPHQAGRGGEFTVNPLTGWLPLDGYTDNGTVTKNIGTAGTFQTFCAEVIESISGFPATYEAALNIGVVKGGVNGTDLLSVGTGWLYCRFATGVLDGYNYGTGRTTTAAQLQDAIWWLEDEIAIATPMDNPFLAAASSEFGDLTAAKADGGWTYGVFSINLTTVTGGEDRQDVIVWIPQVPDGGLTLALLGFGLVGIETLRRKLKA